LKGISIQLAQTDLRPTLHTDMSASGLQETVVWHDLPSDPLAAWYYKNDEGSSAANEAVMKAAANAGESS